MLEFLTDFYAGEIVTSPDDLEVSQKRYASIIPTMQNLVDNYYENIDPPTFWLLCRSLVRAALFRNIKKDKAKPNAKANSKESNPVNEAESELGLPSFLTHYLPSSESMIDACKKMILPLDDTKSVWKYFTIFFYETFWCLSLY